MWDRALVLVLVRRWDRCRVIHQKPRSRATHSSRQGLVIPAHAGNFLKRAWNSFPSPRLERGPTQRLSAHALYKRVGPPLLFLPTRHRVSSHSAKGGYTLGVINSTCDKQPHITESVCPVSNYSYASIG